MILGILITLAIGFGAIGCIILGYIMGSAAAIRDINENTAVFAPRPRRRG